MAAIAALPAWALIAGSAVAATGASLIASKAMAPKAQPISPASQITTRSAAMDRAATNDILSRRTGTDADRRLSFGAGEAFTGPRRSLLGRA